MEVIRLKYLERLGWTKNRDGFSEGFLRIRLPLYLSPLPCLRRQHGEDVPEGCRKLELADLVHCDRRGKEGRRLIPTSRIFQGYLRGKVRYTYRLDKEVLPTINLLYPS